MIIIQDSPDTPAASKEAPFVTHDGPIWPVCRPDMVDPEPIRARMAQDALLVFDREGLVSEDGLARLGWPRASIRRHGDHAREDFVRLLAARFKARRGVPIGRAAA